MKKKQSINQFTNQKTSTEIFNDIYEQYYKYVFNWFKKDFGFEDAEDLTQQTFMRLWAWLPCADNIKSRKSLIFKIAKSVRLDKYRKNAVTISAMYIPDDFDIADLNSEINMIDLKLSAGRLSVKDQQILFMKLSGYSSEEIGREYDISASAVRTRLQSIRKKLK